MRDFGPSPHLRAWISEHLDPLEASVLGGQKIRSDFDLTQPHGPREQIDLTPAGDRRRFYAMTWEDRFIWGATAGMLRALYDRLIGAAVA